MFTSSGQVPTICGATLGCGLPAADAATGIATAKASAATTAIRVRRDFTVFLPGCWVASAVKLLLSIGFRPTSGVHRHLPDRDTNLAVDRCSLLRRRLPSSFRVP